MTVKYIPFVTLVYCIFILLLLFYFIFFFFTYFWASIRAFHRTLFCAVSLAVSQVEFIWDSSCRIDLLHEAFGQPTRQITWRVQCHPDNTFGALFESVSCPGPFCLPYLEIHREDSSAYYIFFGHKTPHRFLYDLYLINLI